MTRHATGARPRGVPLIRTPRTLPRILSPAEVDALFAVLRTQRDHAMVEAMVLGGLRRCEVLALRLEDLKTAERRVFVVEGKGGHHRLIPVSARFFNTVAGYLRDERPADCATDRGPQLGRLHPRHLRPCHARHAVRGLRASLPSSTTPTVSTTPPRTECEHFVSILLSHPTDGSPANEKTPG